VRGVPTPPKLQPSGSLLGELFREFFRDGVEQSEELEQLELGDLSSYSS